MELNGQLRSVRSLAIKRRQIKGKILRLQARLTEVEDGQLLPSLLPEVRVFARNIQTFHGELNQVHREMDENEPFADERLVHDVECAELEGLLLGANRRIVALNEALVSQPVQAAALDQQALVAPQKKIAETPLSTTEARGEGGSAGTDAVPASVTTEIDPAEPDAPDTRVGAQDDPDLSPPIAETERGKSVCTLCNGCQSKSDSFTPREVPVGQEEMEPNLSSTQRLPEISQQPENPDQEHHAMQPPTEPEEASLEERGKTDGPVVLEAGPTLKTEWIDGEPDDGTHQAGTRGSLLPTDEGGKVGIQERALPCSAHQGCTAPKGQEDENALGVSEANPTPVPKIVFAEQEDDTCQAAMKDPLLPVEPSLPNQDRSPTSSTQPGRTVSVVQEDAAKNLNEKPDTRNSGMNPDNDEETEQIQEITTINSGEYKWTHPCFATLPPEAQARTICLRTERQPDRKYVARSRASRAARSGRAVEALHEPAISTSTVKSPRLIWDPGVE